MKYLPKRSRWSRDSAITIARYRKADALVAVFEKAHITAQQLEHASERTWKIAAQAAGTTIPSEATRVLVREILASPPRKSPHQSPVCVS